MTTNPNDVCAALLAEVDSPCEVVDGDWHAARRVGGSSIATLVGANPFAAAPALDAYLEAIGAPRDEPGPAAKWGHWLEGPLLIELSELRDIPFLHFGHTCLRRRDRDWETCSPDGLCVVDGKLVGADVKTTRARSGAWGTPGTDQVPERVFVQMQWCMHVTGADVWHVIVGFRDDCTSDPYVIRRDDEFIAVLRDVAEEFWSEHVVPRRPPQPAQWGGKTWDTAHARGRVAWKSAFHDLADRMRASAVAARKLAAEQPGVAELAQRNLEQLEATIDNTIERHRAAGEDA